MFKLKPCQFCGSDAKVVKHTIGYIDCYGEFNPFVVKCTNRKCSMNYFVKFKKTEQEAIESWNTIKLRS